MPSTNESASTTVLPNQPKASAPDERASLPPETRVWDMCSAGVWGWLFPRRCAGRTWNGALWQAWVWHAIISFLTFFVVTAIIAWYAEAEPLAIWNEMVEEFERDPREFLLTLAITIGVIEAGVALLALAVMPWGCQDEPIGRSFANTFRQTWLHTTHALVGLPLLVLLIIGFIEWEESFQQVHGYRWDYTGGALEYERLKPALLQYFPLLMALLVCLAGVWFIWSLVRAVAAPRPGATIPRDPMCEFCGYNLVATPMDSRCPECGRPVVDSLGDHVRAGPPWDQDCVFGPLRTWRRNTFMAVFRPSAFGRMIPARIPLFGHGVVLSLHLVTWYVGAFSMTKVIAWLERQRRRRGNYEYYESFVEESAEILLYLAFVLLIALGVMGLWAWLVTVVRRGGSGRNLGRVAVVMTSYASGLPVFWSLFVWAIFTVAFGADLENDLERMLRNRYVDPDVILGALWIIPSLIVVVWYAGCISRGTLAARWANR